MDIDMEQKEIELAVVCACNRVIDPLLLALGKYMKYINIAGSFRFRAAADPGNRQEERYEPLRITSNVASRDNARTITHLPPSAPRGAQRWFSRSAEHWGATKTPTPGSPVAPDS